MSRETWLASHPYLQPMAELHALVEGAVAELDLPNVPVPRWDDYLEEFRAGVPLLESSGAAIDLSDAAGPLAILVIQAANLPLPDPLASECRTLLSELRGDPETAERWVAWLLERESPAPPGQGLLLYLGWTVLARQLRAVVGEFGRWRDEERWLRNYCPTCGAPPAMGQLVGKDPGRMRFLVCGCCRTRWRFRRTLCPFCETDAAELSTVAIEGERGLRVDYCESCHGYLKTYTGDRDEELLLADWTTVHLDVLARDRGLKRMAGSLYEW